MRKQQKNSIAVRSTRKSTNRVGQWDTSTVKIRAFKAQVNNSACDIVARCVLEHAQTDRTENRTILHFPPVSVSVCLSIILAPPASVSRTQAAGVWRPQVKHEDNSY